MSDRKRFDPSYSDSLWFCYEEIMVCLVINGPELLKSEEWKRTHED